MAARENQGYLIAIILLVLLTVILAILTYFAFSQAGASSSVLKETERRLAVASGQATAFEQQAGVLKAYLGFGSDYTVAEVEERIKQIERTNIETVVNETASIREQYLADMSRYLRPTADGVEKHYKGLVDDMNIAMMASHRERIYQNNRVEVVEEEKRELERIKNKEIEDIRTQLEQARRDYAAEQERHNNTRNSLQTELDNAKNQNRQLNARFEDERKLWSGEREQLVKARTDAETRARGLEQKLAKYEVRQLDTVDGQIIRVATAMNRVYIDIGSADNLQLRQSFAVYDQSLSSYEKGMEKAKIEVTNITGPNTAEAQIIESSNINPILTGDKVISSSWERGFSVPVALAGFFDIDGDGRSDLERVISLIRQNGGTVVAYYDEVNERVVGSVNQDTRYLVVGSEPEKPSHLQGMSAIERQARDFVVQRVALREFLNSMGVRMQGRIEEGTGTIDRSTRFPERRPPATRPGSAFDN
ncbi:MAG TPA: hypothetical protein PKD64_09085 [Pirellulaceae bacterium]|nr:hypothetical protein [Pirellulaceae bacterium]HMO92341.1 hypothetical protein [Pirellulaceae bacterium]HMP69265.1 hypothetical protein [Pirellulaceae bacterium]